MFCQGLFFFILEIGKILVLLSADTTGMGPLAVEGRLLSGHEVSRLERVPGRPADR